jgi:hypothetical protein
LRTNQHWNFRHEFPRGPKLKNPCIGEFWYSSLPQGHSHRVKLNPPLPRFALLKETLYKRDFSKNSQKFVTYPPAALFISQRIRASRYFGPWKPRLYTLMGGGVRYENMDFWEWCKKSQFLT